MKHLERFRKIIRLAVKMCWLEKDPFAMFQLKFDKTERGFLTLAELNRLENKKLTIERTAYVRDLFDRFAGSFDEQLLKNLGYRAPQVLIEALGAAAEGEALDVLDAGCGTGLCGPLIRARARQLVGVDLSAGMLEQARGRDCYDALVESELSAYLLAHPRSCDLVLCADTLVYFGDLGNVLSLTYAALRPGGRLAFSLEALVGADYELSPSGRYRHARRYVEATLAAAGFVQVQIVEETLRKEAGRWVDGWVVLARRAA
jgi:predicted TPR repeat methyltransferase